jgi:hypothetical protein
MTAKTPQNHWIDKVELSRWFAEHVESIAAVRPAWADPDLTWVDLLRVDGEEDLDPDMVEFRRNVGSVAIEQSCFIDHGVLTLQGEPQIRVVNSTDDHNVFSIESAEEIAPDMYHAVCLARGGDPDVLAPGRERSAARRIPYRVDGDSDRVLAYFPEIFIAVSEYRSQGRPLPRRVLRGMTRAKAIIDTAETLLRRHARNGHHDLALDVHATPHPHMRAAGDRADEWVRTALAAGELTVDDPDWRGNSHPELTAFVEGTSCYPGWADA